MLLLRHARYRCYFYHLYSTTTTITNSLASPPRYQVPPGIGSWWPGPAAAVNEFVHQMHDHAARALLSLLAAGAAAILVFGGAGHLLGKVGDKADEAKAAKKATRRAELAEAHAEHHRRAGVPVDHHAPMSVPVAPTRLPPPAARRPKPKPQPKSRFDALDKGYVGGDLGGLMYVKKDDGEADSSDSE